MYTFRTGPTPTPRKRVPQPKRIRCGRRQRRALCAPTSRHGMQTAAGKREALLHGTDVSPRAAAEGTLPAVLPDRRGGSRPVRRARDRRRSDRNAVRCFSGAPASRARISTSIPSAASIAAPIRRAAARRVAQGDRKLGPDSQRRIETNPLRVLDSKLPEEQPIIEKLPRISDHLCDACREHFVEAEGRTQTARHRLRGKLAPRARPRLLHAHHVRSHRRRPGLAERSLRRRPLRRPGRASRRPADQRHRLRHRHRPRHPVHTRVREITALAGPSGFRRMDGTGRVSDAVQYHAKTSRMQAWPSSCPPEEMKFKKSLGLADKLGARYALIIGEDEVNSGTFTLKRLADSDQKKLSEFDLLEYLESERRGTRA